MSFIETDGVPLAVDYSTEQLGEATRFLVKCVPGHVVGEGDSFTHARYRLTQLLEAAWRRHPDGRFGWWWNKFLQSESWER